MCENQHTKDQCGTKVQNEDVKLEVSVHQQFIME
jgi:hypothetical protein